MSRATMKSKWKGCGSFRTQKRADTKFEALEKEHPDKTFCIMIRRFDDKDKRRYQVKEFVRKGKKNV